MDKNQYVPNMNCLKNFHCFTRNLKKFPFIFPPNKIGYLRNDIFKVSRPIIKSSLIRKTKLINIKTDILELIASNNKLAFLKPKGHFEN